MDRFIIEVEAAFTLHYVASVYETRDYFVVQYVCFDAEKNITYSIDKYYAKTKLRSDYIRGFKDLHYYPFTSRIKVKMSVRSYIN